MDDAALRQLAVHLAAQLPEDREQALATIDLLKNLAETWLFPPSSQLAQPSQEAAQGNVIGIRARLEPIRCDPDTQSF
jgi:hypothetical protein